MPTETERQVLALLAKEWDYSGPPGIMDVSDVVVALPLAPSETLDALKQLFSDGLVDMNKLKTAVFLTPEGYVETGNQGRSNFILPLLSLTHNEVALQ
jgi:Mn-dependent DtxR family transcriptional regulator